MANKEKQAQEAEESEEPADGEPAAASKQGFVKKLLGNKKLLMITGGGGVDYDITSTVVFDASYRFSRISTDPSGTNVNRVGAGIGIRF